MYIRVSLFFNDPLILHEKVTNDEKTLSHSFFKVIFLKSLFEFDNSYLNLMY